VRTMRLALIACVVSMSTVALAQRTVSKGAAAAPAPRQTQAAPRPPAPPPPGPPRTTPPPIVFPLPSVTPPPSGGLTPPAPFTPPPAAGTPRIDIFRNGRRDPFGTRFHTPGVTGFGGYGLGAVGAYATDTTAADTGAVAAAPAATGLLRLSVTPDEAQVFVDSYYVGTVADVEAGRALTLPAGPHRLEIRAPGYQSIAVDVRIAPYETLTYRAALERIPPAAPPTRPAATSGSPMYLIPNCYLGNVPPRPSRLPSGCDITRVQVLGAR
jgi:PEGA domain